MANGQHDEQSCQAEHVKRGGLIHQGVVIDTRNQEHAHHADADPGELSPLQAGHVGGGMRGGVNFEDADGADRGNDGEQGPVEVLSARTVFHRFKRFRWHRFNSFTGLLHRRLRPAGEPGQEAVAE